jgi:ankyrin repeat protein
MQNAGRKIAMIKHVRRWFNWNANGLACAVKDNDLCLVGKLIDRGANINKRRLDLAAPLHLASANGCLEMVELLLDRGAHINVTHGPTCVVRGVSDLGHYRGWTPLHIATYFGHKAIVEHLIQKGANIEARTDAGVLFHYGTVLHISVKFSDAEIVRLLVSKGADINALTGKSLSTCLQLAEKRVRDNNGSESQAVLSVISSCDHAVRNMNSLYRVADSLVIGKPSDPLPVGEALGS